MRTAQGENTMKHTKNTKSFASRWGFILASVGSAVGSEGTSVGSTLSSGAAPGVVSGVTVADGDA